MMLDFDLNFLKEATGLVDSKLVRLESETNASHDPDQFGVLDRIEYVLGFGFVACQQYITVTCSRKRKSKGNALAYGPAHRCGKSMAQLVNEAANYWKHSTEWVRLGRQKRTRETLSELGVDTTREYVMVAVIHELLTPFPPRFERVVPFLVSWRDDVPQSNEATI